MASFNKNAAKIQVDPLDERDGILVAPGLPIARQRLCQVCSKRFGTLYGSSTECPNHVRQYSKSPLSILPNALTNHEPEGTCNGFGPPSIRWRAEFSDRVVKPYLSLKAGWCLSFSERITLAGSKASVPYGMNMFHLARHSRISAGTMRSFTSAELPWESPLR